MHASIQCGIVPSNVIQETDSLFPCFSKSYQQFLYYTSVWLDVARCIVSIMANTSLESETLLTKHSDACKYSCLLFWQIAIYGAVFSCNFDHKSIVTEL